MQAQIWGLKSILLLVVIVSRERKQFLGLHRCPRNILSGIYHLMDENEIFPSYQPETPQIKSLTYYFHRSHCPSLGYLLYIGRELMSYILHDQLTMI